MTNGSENNLVMPVAPMYNGYNGGGCGFGNGWGDGWWILLLLLFAGGWNNGFGGGFGGNDGVLPYMWNTQTQNDVNRGFDTANLSGQLSGIQSAITNGFASAEVANCNRTIDSMQTAYTNQIASMNQRFSDLTAMTQNYNALSSQLAQCCCDNKSATQDLKYTLATEACATRQNSTANTQAILDKLCQLELDGYKRENDNLRTQLNMATLSASQTAQNAFIQKGFSDEVDALYNRLNSCPVPTTPVYGRTPIFQCNQNTGCGCGM